jgi:hypothetical protein
VELAGAGGPGGEAGKLRDVEGGHREEARAGAIARRHENRAELLLERHQFAHQGCRLHAEPRAIDVREGHHLEQAERRASEQRDAAGRREATRLLEIRAHTLEIRRHTVRDGAFQPLAPHRPERLADAVLHLDEILATGLVARLELQVARDDAVRLPPLDGGEPPQHVADGALGRGDR